MSTDILPVAGPPGHLTPPAGGRWTVAEYEGLPDDGLRYEVVEGDLRMTPAPGTGHQMIAVRMVYFFYARIETTGLGRVFAAPIDVELSFDTIVQPDLVVVRNDGAAQITERRIVGPPDLIVEIASPSTASYDRREKRDAYAAAGVREYWIADPASRTVELLTLAGAVYHADHVYRGQALIPSAVIPAWDVATDQLFG